MVVELIVKIAELFVLPSALAGGWLMLLRKFICICKGWNRL